MSRGAGGLRGFRAQCGCGGFGGFGGYNKYHMAGRGRTHITWPAEDSELRTLNSGLRTQDSDALGFLHEKVFLTCNVRDADQDGGAAA